MENKINEWGLTPDEVKYLEETGYRGLPDAFVSLIAKGDKKAVEIFNRIKGNLLTASREYIEANIQRYNMQ